VPHEAFMRAALAEAARAAALDEVPIGAVIVHEGAIIGAGFNQPISSHDPTAHAEVVALRAAAWRSATTAHRRDDVCDRRAVPMCRRDDSRAHRLLSLGAVEPKAGAIQSMTNAHELPGLNHRLSSIGGVLADESRQLQQFFTRGGSALEAAIRNEPDHRDRENSASEIHEFTNDSATARMGS
jgi:tRNA(Arg) A34 adenosine deaminase TadA